MEVGDFFVARPRSFASRPSAVRAAFRGLPPVIHLDGGSGKAAVLRADAISTGGPRAWDAHADAPCAHIMPLQVLKAPIGVSSRDENWLAQIRHLSQRGGYSPDGIRVRCSLQRFRKAGQHVASRGLRSRSTGRLGGSADGVP